MASGKDSGRTLGYMSRKDTEVKVPRPTRVKNKTPAAVQITAEQILREAREREEAEIRPPKQRITDSTELSDYRLRRRKEFEDKIRRAKWNIQVWVKYAQWEESLKDYARARSVWERAIEGDFRNDTLWLKYAEFEMKNKFINRARNVWDRAVTLLPHIDQLWQLNLTGERQILGNAIGKAPKDKDGRSGGGFVMHISEDEMESDEDEESDQGEVEDHSQICTAGERDELYLSDESDDEFDHEPESFLMNKMGLAESALYDVINDHQTEIKEDIRNQVSFVETKIMNEIETSCSAIACVEKYSETRKEVERKLNLQYQRKVAEALDTHLTAVQREHEIKSQIEERKLRSEEAQEEARKRERAFQEEKIRQEKAWADAEMLAKIRAEEGKKEVERKAAKEVAEKEAADCKAAEQKLAEEKAMIERVCVAGSKATSNAQAGGELSSSKSIQAAESALTLEKYRLKKLEELEAMNQSLKSISNENFSSFEKHIGRVVRQITGLKDNVSAKINDIVKIFKDPRCSVSISIATFAKKMVSSSQHPFACSYVIVYVTSQFPEAMDILLAEFHKACIYTVPKHIINSQSAWDSDAYDRIASIMRLYGALVQTDVRGGNATNIHGIEHGWAWLARFLNKISANNKATATALNAFLQTAGFGLHQRYKSQFVKVVNVIREHFLQKLKAKNDTSDLALIIADITAYLDDRMYLKEPEGRTLKTTGLLSKEFTEELEHLQWCSIFRDISIFLAK